MKINRVESRLSHKPLIIIVIVLLVLVSLAWRYYAMRNYDWTGIYASQHCSHVNTEDYDYIADCIIVINTSSFGFEHSFDISSVSKSAVYEARGHIFSNALYRLSEDRHLLIDFFSPLPKPEDNPQDVIGLAFEAGQPQIITHNNEIYHRVKDTLFEPPTTTLEETHKPRVRHQPAAISSLYDAIAPHSIWTADDGSTLLLQSTLNQSCYLPHKLCPALVLTKGEYSASLVIGDLKLVSEDAYHGTLTMQSNQCGIWDKQSGQNKSVGKVETFVFGFDVIDYVNPKLTTLDFSIAGKAYHYQLTKADEQEPSRSDLGMPRLNIKHHQADDDKIQANTRHYDGCNLWLIPN